MKRGRDDPPGGPSKRPAGYMPPGRPGMPPYGAYGPPAGRHGPGVAAPQQPDGRNLTTNDALSYLRDVKQMFAHDKHVYDTFLEIMKDFKAQRIDTTGVIERVKNLFKGHKQLILGFNTFLPDAAAAKQPVEFDQAINYVNKIKARYADNERVYKTFLEILNSYRKGQRSIALVYEEVSLLFNKQPDLLEEFTYFLPDSTPPQAGRRPVGGVGRQRGGYPARAPPAGPPNKRKRDRREEDRRANAAKDAAFFERVRAKLRNREAFEDLLKCINLFATDIISKQELFGLVHDVLGRYPDLMSLFREFIDRCEANDFDTDPRVYDRMRYQQQHRSRAAVEQYARRPISELDVGHWQRATPSYVRLPGDYPQLHTCARTPLARELLNDEWVSVTTGSEDYSFKHFRKNQYEEFLFRTEDDKYELDMCINANTSAIKAMEPLAHAIEALPPDERPNYKMPADSLNAIHYRAVQRIYGEQPGEQGAYVVELLRKNPGVAVPVVLGRLLQKDAEWRQVREEMRETWHRVYEQNYHKSLDHRSFYFKQTEKKNLGAKTMLQEIKEVVDKRRSEDQAINLISRPTDLHSRLSADLTYDYSDLAVHNDTLRILRFAIDEFIGGETTAKANEFVDIIMERLFQFAQEPTIGGAPPSPLPEHLAKGAKKAADTDDDGGEESSDTGKRTPMDTDAGDDAEGRRRKGAAKEETGDTGDKEAKDSDEESEDEAASLPGCEHCKPLATYVGERVAAQQGPASLPAGRVLYGNDAIYLFFRLHQLLYDRLRQARRCIADKDKPTFRQTGEAPQAEEGPSPEEQARLHKEYMRLVFELIGGKIDSSAYEDAVRSMLGTNSYMLFTLYQLVHKAVKQLQNVLTDDVSGRLVELYRYECSRSTPFLEAVYRANSHVLLADEHCFRLQGAEGGRLTIQLMEPDRSEVPPGIVDPSFSEYLATFIDEVGEAKADARLFLGRNLTLDQDLAAYPPSLLARCITRNGLECKIACASSKVSYVLDTEDLFVRARAARSVNAAAQEARAARFRAKVEALCSAVPAVEAEAPPALPVAEAAA